jgi:hypothetical protein
MKRKCVYCKNEIPTKKRLHAIYCSRDCRDAQNQENYWVKKLKKRKVVCPS